MKEDLIRIYIDKNGEIDFGVVGTMGALTLEQLNKVRQMIPVAIWCAEDMWRRNNEQLAGQDALSKEKEKV
jgi:hypothetical protein